MSFFCLVLAEDLFEIMVMPSHLMLAEYSLSDSTFGAKKISISPLILAFNTPFPQPRILLSGEK